MGGGLWPTTHLSAPLTPHGTHDPEAFTTLSYEAWGTFVWGAHNWAGYPRREGPGQGEEGLWGAHLEDVSLGSSAKSDTGPAFVSAGHSGTHKPSLRAWPSGLDNGRQLWLWRAQMIGYFAWPER